MTTEERTAELIRLRTRASDLRDNAAFADTAAARAADLGEAVRLERRIAELEAQPA